MFPLGLTLTPRKRRFPVRQWNYGSVLNLVEPALGNWVESTNSQEAQNQSDNDDYADDPYDLVHVAPFLLLPRTLFTIRWPRRLFVSERSCPMQSVLGAFPMVRCVCWRSGGRAWWRVIAI